MRSGSVLPATPRRPTRRAVPKRPRRCFLLASACSRNSSLSALLSSGSGAAVGVSGDKVSFLVAVSESEDAGAAVGGAATAGFVVVLLTVSPGFRGRFTLTSVPSGLRAVMILYRTAASGVVGSAGVPLVLGVSVLGTVGVGFAASAFFCASSSSGVSLFFAVMKVPSGFRALTHLKPGGGGLVGRGGFDGVGDGLGSAAGAGDDMAGGPLIVLSRLSESCQKQKGSRAGVARSKRGGRSRSTFQDANQRDPQESE
jgi:hypothetical protein